MINTKYKWIEFIQIPSIGVTKVFKCMNSEYGSFLGTVKWYGAFRKYSFFPNDNIVFETQCLKDIANFLDCLMIERKIQKQNSQLTNPTT